MSLTALEKIEAEIVKTEEKIVAYKEKAKALRQRKLDEENAQIIKLIRSADMSVAQLQAMMRPVRQENMVMEEERDV